jgi:hypothetical protein
MQRILLLATVTLVVAAMMVAMAMPAFAAANPRASCNGIGGSTENAEGGPGARAEISHYFKELAEQQGTTPGAFFSSGAKQHLGSIDACFG